MTCRMRRTPSTDEGRELARGTALLIVDNALIEFKRACGPKDHRELFLHTEIEAILTEYTEEMKK